MNTLIEIKNTINKMELQQLNTWLYQSIQKLSEEQQENVLISLKEALYPLPSINWDELNEWITKVDEGEYYFIVDNEYFDYYNQDEYSVLDPNYLLPQIHSIMKNAELAVYHHQYKTAKKLYGLLLKTNFQLFNDYDFEEYVLNDKHILDENQFKFMLNQYFMVSYQVNSYNCFDELYPIMQQYSDDFFINETLEPSWNNAFNPSDVIESWFDYFETHFSFENNKQCTLLCQYLNDFQQWHDQASRLCSIYPSFAFDATEHLYSHHEFKLCESLADSCLNQIAITNPVRGTILSIGAKAAKQLDNVPLYKKMLLQAFYSNSTIENYIELYLDKTNENDAYNFAIELHNHPISQQNCNQINQDTLSQIQFLHFSVNQLLFENFFKDHNSSSLLAFILYLLNKLPSDNYDYFLLNRVKNIYYRYTKAQIDDTAFTKLKKYYQVNENEIHLILNAIYPSLLNMCDSILGNTERNSYSYLANFVIVFDTVSIENNVGLSLLKECKRNYPRRPAFYGDLKKIYDTKK